ncbi:MAG: hypothetical protein IJ863_03635 [Spirochaetales bacterium]|nr:hypothetical protein [Spirochaetales bacterium]
MGRYFAEVHEGPGSQLGSLPETVKDTEEIVEMRRSLDSISAVEERYEAMLALSKALVFQLRYKSALDVLDQAVSLCPSRTEALRMRAIRRLYTLDTQGSLDDFLRLREMNYGDVSYQIGLGHFMSGQYGKAMEEMETCYGLADNEMKIAAMYWHTIAARRCNGKASLLGNYTDGFECGHHTAYKAACAMFAGHGTESELYGLACRERSDLEFSMLGYAMHEVGAMPLDVIVARDSFWIGFAYVAAWNELHYQGKGRSFK